jgi:tetratricopeptide (TPR) repeat protein
VQTASAPGCTSDTSLLQLRARTEQAPSGIRVVTSRLTRVRELPQWTSVNNLAGAYRAAGDLGRAIPLFERALADRRRVLGDDRPDTFTSVNNLAGAYESAGDLGRAIPLYERALTDCRRVLGDDHPDHPLTKTVRGNARTARQQ